MSPCGTRRTFPRLGGRATRSLLVPPPASSQILTHVANPRGGRGDAAEGDDAMAGVRYRSAAGQTYFDRCDSDADGVREADAGSHTRARRSRPTRAPAAGSDMGVRDPVRMLMIDAANVI